MSSYPSPSHDRSAITEVEEVSLLDVVDTALNKGVVVQGDATISVADVDLVFLGVRLVLAAVDTLESDATLRSSDATSLRSTSSLPGSSIPRCNPDAGPARGECAGPLDPSAESVGRAHRCAPPVPVGATRGVAPGRGDASPLQQPAEPLADADRMERGLAKLVLTVVELLRQLLEKQALRRMERGSLTAEQIERMGQPFQRLESKMEELKAVFGLDGEDLNLNLGPLGNLI